VPPNQKYFKKPFYNQRRQQWRARGVVNGGYFIAL